MKKEEKTTRKGSSSVTIKSFNQSVNKLKELKMVTDEEYKQLVNLKKTIFDRWVAIDMGMEIQEYGESTR